MLRELLRHKNIAVQCPDNPDADSIAAAFGLRDFFKKAGKHVNCFYAGERPVAQPNLVEMLRLLDFNLEHRPGAQTHDGLLLMLNCQPGSDNVTPARSPDTAVLGKHLPLLPLPDMSDVRPHLSACSTLLWQLLKEADHPLTVEVATAFLYALDVATNGFAEVRFPLDLDMRDHLLPLLENNMRDYNKLKRSNLSLHDLSLSARALDTLDYHAENRFALLNVLPVDPSVPAFLVDLALRVNDVDLAVAFSESDAELRFSVRSGARETKALDLARWFLAGGRGRKVAVRKRPAAPLPERGPRPGQIRPLISFLAGCRTTFRPTISSTAPRPAGSARRACARFKNCP